MIGIGLWIGQCEKAIKQESSCMKARSILTAAYQVLHVLSCPGGGTQVTPPPSWPGPGGLHWGGCPQAGLPPILTWPGGYPGVGTPILTWLGGTPGGHPLAGVPPILTWLGDTPGRHPPPAGVPPILTWPAVKGGYPRQGYPPVWTWPGYPPGLDLTGVPNVDRWMDGQTRVKTLPSRRTTYAVGNKQTK